MLGVTGSLKGCFSVISVLNFFFLIIFYIYIFLLSFFPPLHWLPTAALMFAYFIFFFFPYFDVLNIFWSIYC